MSTDSPTKTQPPLAFVDTETLGLDPEEHDLWEIAVVRREADGTHTEHLWQKRPTELAVIHAEPKALEINRFHERMAVPRDVTAVDMLDDIGDDHTPVPLTLGELVKAVTTVLDGAILIGSNPAFDASFLRMMLDAAPWHYRTIDIATLAAGYRHGQAASGAYGGDFAFANDYPALPYRSYDLSRAVGVEPPSAEEAHTALGDARWAMAVYDAVTGGVK